MAAIEGNRAGAATSQGAQPSFTRRVLVSVLSYNSSRTTLDALRSLSRQTYPEYHLQLIDNGSTDGTAAAAAREFPDLEVRMLSENCGYTGGCNLALRQARDEGYGGVILCNHDVEVDERAIEFLVKTASARPSTGAVGAVEHNLFTGARRASGGGRYSKWFSRTEWQRAPAEEKDDAQREVFCVHGALVLITADALAAGVRMDESLFMYFDEVDIGFQLRENGLSAIVDGRVLVGHKSNPRPYSPQVGYLMQRNRLYMARKRGRWYHQAFYIIYSTIFELPAKVAVRSLQGHADFAMACVAGQIDGLLGRMGPGRLKAKRREATGGRRE